MSRPCVMQGGMRRLHRRDALSLSIRPLEIMEERTQGDRGLRDMVEVAVIEEEDRGGMEEEEEAEEAEGDFEDMTLFSDCDAKVKEMKELFDRAMRFHRKSMEKATTEMPRKEWELEMANVE